MRLTTAITHEAPWYVDEALVNLGEALELYVEDAPLPEGVEPPIIASVEIAA